MDPDGVAARRVVDPAWALSVSPLVISGASTVDLLSDGNLFTGFDELWIPTGLPVEQPPEDASLVAPRELGTETPAPVLAWLAASRCRLGVGDGGGMSYAVSDVDLGRERGLDEKSGHGMGAGRCAHDDRPLAGPSASGTAQSRWHAGRRANGLA